MLFLCKPIYAEWIFQSLSIPILGLLGGIFILHFYSNFLLANSGEPDQTTRFAASDLVLHCLPMSHKIDAKLIWVYLSCTGPLIKLFHYAIFQKFFHIFLIRKWPMFYYTWLVNNHAILFL